ncbi:MAG TPA: hypothetical protein VLB67_00195 [Acidimicrobiia bacterium]|nr:hypothetical protein [Acidimicrobiia bacterium]
MASFVVGEEQHGGAETGGGGSGAPGESLRVVGVGIGSIRPNGTPKFQPETPVPAATRIACSRSVSGTGSSADRYDSGPDGISMPVPNLRARRPLMASTSGKSSSSSSGPSLVVSTIVAPRFA